MCVINANGFIGHTHTHNTPCLLMFFCLFLDLVVALSKKKKQPIEDKQFR